MEKVAVKSVTVTRAEGLTAECITRTVGSLNDATSMLRQWSRSAPDAAKRGGYDKCDFTIEFTDGYEYKGRYDMQLDLREKDGTVVTLQRHVQSHCMFYAGLWRPAHLTKDRYRSFMATIDSEDIAAYREFLNHYDLGESEIVSNVEDK